MQLDKRARKTLGVVHAHARITLKDLGSKLQISKESAGYRLKKLSEQEIIESFSINVNSSLLGYYYYMIFLTFVQLTPSLEQDIIDFLLSVDGVAQVHCMEGSHNISFVFLSKGRAETRDFLTHLAESHGEKIANREISLLTTIYHFTPGYFLPDNSSVTIYTLSLHRRVAIDDIDRELLRHLSENSRVPLQRIARIMGVDRTTLRYRQKRLEEAGVITSYEAHVNYLALGFLSTCLYITVAKVNNLQQVVDFFHVRGVCSAAYELVGRYDLAIELVFESVEGRRACIAEFRERFTDVLLKYDFADITHTIDGGWNPFTLYKN